MRRSSGSWEDSDLPPAVVRKQSDSEDSVARRSMRRRSLHCELKGCRLAVRYEKCPKVSKIPEDYKNPLSAVSKENLEIINKLQVLLQYTK